MNKENFVQEEDTKRFSIQLFIDEQGNISATRLLHYLNFVRADQPRQVPLSETVSSERSNYNINTFKKQKP